MATDIPKHKQHLELTKQERLDLNFLANTNPKIKTKLAFLLSGNSKDYKDMFLEEIEKTISQGYITDNLLDRIKESSFDQNYNTFKKRVLLKNGSPINKGIFESLDNMISRFRRLDKGLQVIGISQSAIDEINRKNKDTVNNILKQLENKELIYNLGQDQINPLIVIIKKGLSPKKDISDHTMIVKIYEIIKPQVKISDEQITTDYPQLIRDMYNYTGRNIPEDKTKKI